ncbi:MAG: glycosyltransferase [Nitrospiraceae bacterium]
MSTAHPTTRIAMVLFNNSSSGGAERRYAQVYEYLRHRKVNVSLAINQSLFEVLSQAGVLSEDTPDLVVKEWTTSLSTYLLKTADNAETTNSVFEALVRRTLHAVAFGIRKADYAIGCLPVAWWILRRRPHVLHLILGGAYVALPLQLLHFAPPAMISVVCPSLRAMVGSGLGYHLYRVALRCAHAVDALTDSIREALKVEGVSPQCIRVSPGSFVNTTRFAPANVRYPWVVFAGRLVPEKNPDQFVAVCALVHRRLSHAKFFILGDGPLRPRVRALVEQHGLESYTELKWCDRTESILQHALVFVSLQTMDNYPSQALLEAMSCGAAVVATDVGQTNKLVDDSVGQLVDAEPVAIAKAVVNLLENPEQAVAKGLVGRKRVQEQHSTEAYVDYLENLYSDLALVGSGKT